MTLDVADGVLHHGTLEMIGLQLPSVALATVTKVGE